MIPAYPPAMMKRRTAAAYSTFAAAEELWKLAPEIIAALRARGQQQ